MNVRNRNAVPKLADIAKRAGVSVAAVSFALNNNKNSRISEALRKRIRAIADELNYRPNEVAKALSMQRSRILGLMVPLRDPIFYNQFIAQALSGIQATLINRDYNLLVYSPTGKPGKATQERILESRLTDGLIFINTRSCSARDVNDTIQDLDNAGVKFCMMNSYYGRAEIDYVGVNDEELGAAAARYLVMGGHRRIALLSGTSSLPAHAYLVKGLKRGLTEAGIDLEESLIGCTGYDAGKAFLLLDSWFARRRNRPTAIVAADDSLLANIYDYIEARSLKVPDDVALIARTSSASGPLFRPHPTAFAVPTFDMGKLAAEMLIDCIENPNHEKRRIFLPFTFSRGATG